MALKTEKQMQAELRELTERISALRQELQMMVRGAVGTSGRSPKPASSTAHKRKEKKSREEGA